MNPYEVDERNTIEKIVESNWDRLWKKFMTFGTASAGVIATLPILQAINMIINGFILHRICGWSIHMFEAVLSSLTQCLISIVKMSTNSKTTNAYDVQNKVELVKTDDQTQPQYSTIPKTEQSTGTINKHARSRRER